MQLSRSLLVLLTKINVAKMLRLSATQMSNETKASAEEIYMIFAKQK